MPRQRPSRSHLLLIVPLTLLILSEHRIWTQETLSIKAPIQSASLAARFAALPEARVHFHPVWENLSLPFAPNQGETLPLVRFPPLDIGYHPSLPKTNRLPELWQPAKEREQQAKANPFIGNTPTEWLTPIALHYMGCCPPDRNDAVQYYGHRIPWAGRVILGVGKQARFHPRVARVVELIRPGLSFDKPSHRLWTGR